MNPQNQSRYDGASRFEPGPYMLLSEKEAQATARRLNIEDEDGWTYEAVSDPAGNGKAFITITDANGVEIGRL